MDILIFNLYVLTVPADETDSFSRYLPVEDDALRWGLHVVDAGFTEIQPDSPYPPGKHPAEYRLSWDQGRTLNEYQLVYITRGRGIFETQETGRIRIEAGQAFILFPGVWHRYHPVRKQGWDENWIGFNGDVAKRIMEGFFSPEKALIQIGHDQELLDLILSVTKLMQQPSAGYQQLIAARAMEVLAQVRLRSLSYRAVDRDVARKVQDARLHLLEHSAEPVDMNDLASQLGLSYSRFRSVFKESTGTSPHQYHLDIRLNKARELLCHSTLTLTEIADRVGFTDAYYFSRLFKKKKGCSPSSYRRNSGERGKLQ